MQMRKIMAASWGRGTAHATVELWPAILALLLGVTVIVGAGFASLPAVHNAAHDARHSFAFPCH
jgi:cobalt transporter subunit CbtB